MTSDIMDCGIYVITSPSGGQYVGSSVRLRRRLGEHRRMLETGAHANPFLQNAWNKHGHLEFKVILVCSKQNVLFYEQLVMDAIKPKYNLRLTAESPLGALMSLETRARMSASALGRNKGVPRTPEVRAKISAKLLNRKRFPEECAAIARGRLGCNNGQRGRKHTAEHCANISSGRKGKLKDVPRPLDVRQKISATRKERGSCAHQPRGAHGYFTRVVAPMVDA